MSVLDLTPNIVQPCLPYSYGEFHGSLDWNSTDPISCDVHAQECAHELTGSRSGSDPPSTSVIVSRQCSSETDQQRCDLYVDVGMDDLPCGRLVKVCCLADDDNWPSTVRRLLGLVPIGLLARAQLVLDGKLLQFDTDAPPPIHHGLKVQLRYRDALRGGATEQKGDRVYRNMRVAPLPIVNQEPKSHRTDDDHTMWASYIAKTRTVTTERHQHQRYVLAIVALLTAMTVSTALAIVAWRVWRNDELSQGSPMIFTQNRTSDIGFNMSLFFQQVENEYIPMLLGRVWANYTVELGLMTMAINLDTTALVLERINVTRFPENGESARNVLNTTALVQQVLSLIVFNLTEVASLVHVPEPYVNFTEIAALVPVSVPIVNYTEIAALVQIPPVLAPNLTEIALMVHVPTSEVNYTRILQEVSNAVNLSEIASRVRVFISEVNYTRIIESTTGAINLTEIALMVHVPTNEVNYTRIVQEVAGEIHVPAVNLSEVASLVHVPTAAVNYTRIVQEVSDAVNLTDIASMVRVHVPEVNYTRIIQEVADGIHIPMVNLTDVAAMVHVPTPEVNYTRIVQEVTDAVNLTEIASMVHVSIPEVNYTKIFQDVSDAINITAIAKQVVVPSPIVNISEIAIAAAQLVPAALVNTTYIAQVAAELVPVPKVNVTQIATEAARLVPVADVNVTRITEAVVAALTPTTVNITEVVAQVKLALQPKIAYFTNCPIGQMDVPADVSLVFVQGYCSIRLPTGTMGQEIEVGFMVKSSITQIYGQFVAPIATWWMAPSDTFMRFRKTPLGWSAREKSTDDVYWTS
eukprot:TRINITY_DN1139_c0_g1_i2.p1 TRINITY_DN1139_c0_g1~~TRINITY_DN1139_c0_g1_i2.p1  ORF type:complete len:806 (+),score=104.10 TRINITY_DN1139_c0_g1_i2:308-2725(+)